MNALSKDWKSKVTAIEETKNLNTFSIESLINSLTSYALNFKSKVQEKEDIRMKRSIALKVSQEEDDAFSINGEYINIEDNDLTLLTKRLKKFLSNKRRFKRDRPNNNLNQVNASRGKIKQENEQETK